MNELELRIDDEFKNLLPPLSQEEHDTLETSCMLEGIREPLIVWDGVIIDGHNRYSIAQEWDLDFKVEEKIFENREQAKDWIDVNQLGRRNLTLDQRRIIIGRRYNREKKKQGGTGANQFKKEQTGKNYQSATSEKIANENNITEKTVRNYAKDAEFFEQLESEQPETAQKVWSGESSLSDVKPKNNGAHVSNNSGNNEWYTPPEIIDSARKVMGSIDLDPASSIPANQIVRAEKFYDEIDNGLEKDWQGNIWMNPPYSQPLIDGFVEKLLKSELNQAVVLTNNATETRWGSRILTGCHAVCFPTGRIRFVDRHGNPGKAPLQGQMIAYFGDNPSVFVDEFSKYGVCLKQTE